MLTRGERMLMAAEARARRIRVRRRLLTLGAPAVLATALSVAALVRAQHDREAAAGLGHLGPHAAVVAFSAALVALPLLGAVRAQRAAPAALAFLAGPVLTPRMFGPGGWRWWEVLVVGAVCALVSAAAPRRRAARASRQAAT